MDTLPEPAAYDRSTARRIVAQALASIRARGIELSPATLSIYELYAEGNLTPAQLVEALAERSRNTSL